MNEQNDFTTSLYSKHTVVLEDGHITTRIERYDPFIRKSMVHLLQQHQQQQASQQAMDPADKLKKTMALLF